MSLSLLKNYIVAVTILSSFSVDCRRCFLRRLSAVFGAMYPLEGLKKDLLLTLEGVTRASANNTLVYATCKILHNMTIA